MRDWCFFTLNILITITIYYISLLCTNPLYPVDVVAQYTEPPLFLSLFFFFLHTPHSSFPLSCVSYSPMIFYSPTTVTIVALGICGPCGCHWRFIWLNTSYYPSHLLLISLIYTDSYISCMHCCVYRIIQSNHLFLLL